MNSTWPFSFTLSEATPANEGRDQPPPEWSEPPPRFRRSNEGEMFNALADQHMAIMRAIDTMANQQERLMSRAERYDDGVNSILSAVRSNRDLVERHVADLTRTDDRVNTLAHAMAAAAEREKSMTLAVERVASAVEKMDKRLEDVERTISRVRGGVWVLIGVAGLVGFVAQEIIKQLIRVGSGS